jgi:hypothetical protein
MLLAAQWIMRHCTYVKVRERLPVSIYMRAYPKSLILLRSGKREAAQLISIQS